MDDREFSEFDQLSSMSNEDLEKEVIQGTNLHIHMSKASVAKRILENRRQKQQLESIKNVEKVTQHLDTSNKELLAITGSLNEIVKILNFFKSHWLPKQPLWIKISTFLGGTILLGILLNLIASAIAKFWFHW